MQRRMFFIRIFTQLLNNKITIKNRRFIELNNVVIRTLPPFQNMIINSINKWVLHPAVVQLVFNATILKLIKHFSCPVYSIS